MSDDWAAKNNIPCIHTNVGITTATEQKCKVTKQTTSIPIMLGDLQCPWTFLVVPTLSHSIILGTDFALWYRITYDPYDWSLIVLGEANNINKPYSSYLKLFGSSLNGVMIEDAPEIQYTEDVEEGKELEIQKQVQAYKILEPYVALFSPQLGNPPPRDLDFRITLNGTPLPKRHSPYPLSQEKKAAMIEQVTELLTRGAIEPSVSPWSSPILFVKKKEGTWRLCVDYRTLNSFTKPDAYPLPKMATLLRKIGDSRFFTKIDLHSGFHQIPVQAASREYTAFSTPESVQGHSHFQWKVMPFGLINAPAIFQRLMERTLANIPNCIVYIDDILIYAYTKGQHDQVVKLVLQKLWDNKLYIKFSKCDFCKNTVTFLGHTITPGKLTLDKEKVKAITDWEAPLKSGERSAKILGVGFVVRHVPARLGYHCSTTHGIRRRQEEVCMDRGSATSYDHTTKDNHQHPCPQYLGARKTNPSDD